MAAEKAKSSAKSADSQDFVQLADDFVGEAQRLTSDMQRLAQDLESFVPPDRADAFARLATWREQTMAGVATLTHALNALRRRAANSENRKHTGFSIVRAQEEERRRLARDIHDGPAQLLANVVFRIEVSQKLLAIDRDRALAEMDQLKTLVRHSLQDVRKIIFDLRPMALDDLGLLPALRGYLSTFSERSGLATDLVIQGDERRLEPAVEVAGFRIVQEALNNAWKHADATRVTVNAVFSPHRLDLIVTDDGAGFDLDRAGQRRAGYGLMGMRERASLISGRLDIKTAPGAGTKVFVHIPTDTDEGGADS